MGRVVQKVRSRSKAKLKPKSAGRPNLPQHDLPAPYAPLLVLGAYEARATYESVAAQVRAQGIGAGVAQLTRMALDESYYDYLDEDDGFSEDPRSFTRVHAVRTLALLGEDASPAIELLLPLLDEDDDWLREEMPLFYAAIGQPAIEPLASRLMDEGASINLRAGSGDSLAEIGEKRPELRQQIVALLEQALLVGQQDDTLRGYIIINLMDVGARECLPVIEKAFAEDSVDISVVQLPDVQEHFGLPITASYIPIRWERDDVIMAESHEETDLVAWHSTAPATPGGNGKVEDEVRVPYAAVARIGRNEPCSCGSGKKYKKCCGG